MMRLQRDATPIGVECYRETLSDSIACRACFQNLPCVADVCDSERRCDVFLEARWKSADGLEHVATWRTSAISNSVRAFWDPLWGEELFIRTKGELWSASLRNDETRLIARPPRHLKATAMPVQTGEPRILLFASRSHTKKTYGAMHRRTKKHVAWSLNPTNGKCDEAIPYSYVAPACVRIDRRFLITGFRNSLAVWNVSAKEFFNPEPVDFALDAHRSGVDQLKLFPGPDRCWDAFVTTGKSESCVRVWRLKSKRRGVRVGDWPADLFDRNSVSRIRSRRPDPDFCGANRSRARNQLFHEWLRTPVEIRTVVELHCVLNVSLPGTSWVDLDWWTPELLGTCVERFFFLLSSRSQSGTTLVARRRHEHVKRDRVFRFVFFDDLTLIWSTLNRLPETDSSNLSLRRRARLAFAGELVRTGWKTRRILEFLSTWEV